MRKCFAILLLFLLAASASNASSIAGPVLGVVLDQASGGVRPILGVPGAATLGAAVPLGIDTDRAAVSGVSDYVLGAAAGDGRMVLVRNASTSPLPVVLPAVEPSAGRVILSPSGSSAALLYPGRNRLQVIVGLPDAPSMRAEIDLAALPEAPSSIAVSDDGQSVIATLVGGIAVFGPGGAYRIVASATQAAVAFLHHSSDAVFTDSTSNSVFVIRDVGGAAQMAFVARTEEGTAGPAAIQVSRDNRRAIVANSGSGVVASFDLAGGEPMAARCDCQITGLAALSGNSVFRLSDAASGPVWFFDGDAPAGRVLFIPAAAPARAAARPPDRIGVPVPRPAAGGLR
jgi:hypothetical protein